MSISKGSPEDSDKMELSEDGLMEQRQSSADIKQ